MASTNKQIFTVGDIRDFIEPIMDECSVTPMSFSFVLDKGEGKIIVTPLADKEHSHAHKDTGNQTGDSPSGEAGRDS